MLKRPLAILLAFVLMTVGTGCEDVSVTEATVASVEVDPVSASLLPDQTVQLSATPFDASGAPLTGRSAEWTSMDPEIATVSGSGLVRGISTGTAQIRASVQGQSAMASIEVGASPQVALSEAAVQFSATAGGSPTQPIAVSVTNRGGGSLTGLGTSIAWTEGQGGWLEATLSGTSAPTTLALRATPGSLPSGRYEAEVTVTPAGSGVSPGTLSVVFQIADPHPSIGLSPGAVGFASSEGQGTPPSQSVRVTNLGGGSLTGLEASIAYASGGASGWLDAALAGSSAPTDLVLRVDPERLAPGVHDAEVRLTSSGGGSPAVVQVRYRYGEAPPEFAISSGSLTRVVEEDAPVTGPDSIAITNAGSGTLDGITLSVDHAGSAQGWLDARLSSNRAPAHLIVRMDPDGLAPGTYEARARLASSAAVNSPATVLLRLRVEERAIPPSASTSTIGATPSRVGRDEPSTVLVQLRDADGNDMTTGGDDVFLATSLGTLNRTSGTTDDNGRFTATLTSNQVGTATVSAYLGSSASDPLIGTATVTVRGEVDADRSTIEAAPARFTTDENARIRIQLRDTEGNDLEGEGLEVFLVTTIGELARTSGTSNDDGEFETTLRSGTVGTGTVTAYLGTDAEGARIGSVDIRVDVGRVSAEGSTLSVTPTDIRAFDTATIVVQLRDAAGNAVRTAGESVFLGATGGQLSRRTGGTDTEGRFVATIRVNPSDVGTVTVTGWLGSDGSNDDARIGSVQIGVTRW